MQVPGFSKFHCVIGPVTKFVIYTWAASAEAARRQVADFEEVPLSWVTVTPVGAV